MNRPFHHRRKRLKSPVRLSTLVDGHTRRWRLLALHRLEVIRRKWPEAAGDFVATHVVPVRLVRRILRVAAEDTTWLTEMTYLADAILERLRTLLPGDWVEELRTVVGVPMPPLPAPEPEVKLGPPTAEMFNRVEEACNSIEDSALRSAIQRAMLARLRREEADHLK